VYSESTQIEFRFKSPQAIECLTDAEAARIVGEDRESRQRDLYEAIDRGDFPRWRFCVRITQERKPKGTPSLTRIN
jgi:catalase